MIVEASHKNSPAKVGSSGELNWWNWSVIPNHSTLNDDNRRLKLLWDRLLIDLPHSATGHGIHRQIPRELVSETQMK